PVSPPARLHRPPLLYRQVSALLNPAPSSTAFCPKVRPHQTTATRVTRTPALNRREPSFMLRSSNKSPAVYPCAGIPSLNDGFKLLIRRAACLSDRCTPRLPSQKRKSPAEAGLSCSGRRRSGVDQ